MSSPKNNFSLPSDTDIKPPLGLLAAPDDIAVGGGHYAPMYGEGRRATPGAHAPRSHAVDGERMPVEYWEGLAAVTDDRAERALRDANRHQAHHGASRLGVCPEILYRYPPITADQGRICNLQQVENCEDLFLQLLGWGVPMEDIVDYGFSLPATIWICAHLGIRLSWGLVMRANMHRVPFHPASSFPLDYKPVPPQFQ